MSDVGRGYGCGAAIIIAIVPVLPLAFVLGWSGAHCEPVPSCQRQAELRVGLMFAGILLFAAVIGMALRKLLNTLAAKQKANGLSPSFSFKAPLITVGMIGGALAVLYGLAAL